MRQGWLDHESLVIDGGVVIGYLAREQNEHRFEHFMGDGDDRPLGPPTNEQALEVALELRGGSGSCPSDLAQHGADIAIARCGFAAFTLAGRFVVARTEAGPLGESVGGTESGHVDTDFHQELDGGQAIDTGKGQQQLHGRLIGFELIEQAVFEVGQLGLQGIDVLTDHAGEEQVFLTEFPLEGGQQLLPWGFQASGVPQRLFWRAAVEQAVDHGAGRHPVGVGDDRREADAGIAQEAHQAVFLRRQHGRGSVVVAADLAQVAQFLRRDETAAQQPGACQHRQPLGVAGIGLATGHLLDVLGIDHPCPDADLFQSGIGAFPIDTGALHDHGVGSKACDPLGHDASVTLKGTELAAMNLGFTTGLLENHTDVDNGQMHIHADGTAKDRLNIHGDLLGDKGLRNDTCGGPPWPQWLLTSRCRLLWEPIREGRLGCRARSKAAVGGTSRGHRVMLGNGVELPFLQRPWVTPPGGKLLSSTGVSMPNEMNVGIKPPKLTI
jgi:hypothetical protein